ncbi:MAG TPA: HPr kinase/phosphatase C-terminal domain-containing protein [Allosphingosinicella sp.]|nr:HPr kinase/phosphatase C-terminal domain-containing protein [Allosphingosinicella sp.]
MMSGPSLSSETLHASCVAKDGAAILIAGRSGAGKSDLALRLIDRGASLVSDDYTLVRRVSGRLVASSPPAISGKMEVRGLGLVDFETADDVTICLYVDLDREVERLPELIDTIVIAGVSVPVIALDSHHASAPVKVELALDRFGLKL